MSGAYRVGPNTFVGALVHSVESQFPAWLSMPPRPLNIIGPQLRRLRYARGMSQPELAAACQRKGWDIGRDTVANIEGQRRWVADFELMLIARALGVSVDALLPSASQATRALKAFAAT